MYGCNMYHYQYLFLKAWFHINNKDTDIYNTDIAEVSFVKQKLEETFSWSNIFDKRLETSSMK